MPSATGTSGTLLASIGSIGGMTGSFMPRMFARGYDKERCDRMIPPARQDR
ncbi:hypothetical protein Val02_77490 [Virgisporangium aliadipatigenens]|uniref:Uncharacterized protein n=1 Tax=Virgisporangium aliadipatigenens TaxID=741659 RepID=A0A8J4DV74_9ACTN|nr:hypothetical protein Val02_77490 [Virgisporangium aliadipatigenens]